MTEIMRRHLGAGDPMKRSAGLVLATTLVATLVSGCGGTAAPTASSTQLAAVTPNPTAEPTTAPTASPTPGPTLIPYPGPAIPPGTLTIEIGADQHLEFDRTALTAPAHTPFVIAFDNRDLCDANCQKVYSYPLAQIPHNVAIKLGGDLIFNPLPAIPAPTKVDYFLSEGLSAGTYQFLCIIHPTMRGTLSIT